MQQLQTQLRAINHKPYGMYKELAGGYDFKTYLLWIDHVQGDPFASPSRVRVEIPAAGHGFAPSLWDSFEKRIALEDLILRRFGKTLKENEERRMGSGKSGNLTTCRVGQEMLERIAVTISRKSLEGRFEVGFPARGRTILADELITILFEILPKVVEQTFFAAKYRRDTLQKRMELAVNQQAIREQLEEKKLAAFVANGSILPRESGVSARPMKEAVAFSSPPELEVTLKVPYGAPITGMGIPQGVTVITGGGYHGKSTLLKALEAGVYNHIEGDGREYVITRADAMKLRAEDGRSVRDCDISAFIRHLPNGQDTTRFQTENASGSTSQAANVTEAVEAQSRLFLIDEDTTATNFMIRDSLMAQLVADEEEPITPFIRKIRSLYEDHGISTIIVAGSCGDYLAEADVVLRMDRYCVKDVTQQAEELVEKNHCVIPRETFPKLAFTKSWNVTIPKDKYLDYKIKANGTDGISLNYEAVDVRYLEQIVDSGQCITLGLMIRDLLLSDSCRKMSKRQAVEAVFAKVKRGGLAAITPKGYSCGHPVMVRPQELYACMNRIRG
ncbi:MAG: ABC-ATPase domain-containing protein [Lachnospiraceae bacterium]|nr:ABC-ATPase domain-containing protein [Lachnospiraceae bacterium]